MGWLDGTDPAGKRDPALLNGAEAYQRNRREQESPWIIIANNSQVLSGSSEFKEDTRLTRKIGKLLRGTQSANASADHGIGGIRKTHAYEIEENGCCWSIANE